MLNFSFASFNTFRFKFLFGPCFALFFGLLLCFLKVDLKIMFVASITIWMVVWWISEVVSMGVTALLPIIFFPLFGIVSGNSISSVYFSDGVVVCWGSMLMATSIEEYNLHTRFAEYCFQKISHHNHTGLLFIFIFFTGFLSMWMSNTAAAAIMTPLSRAILLEIKQTSKSHAKNDINEFCSENNQTTDSNRSNCDSLDINLELNNEKASNIGKALDFGVAYGSLIGGTATLTGTGTNLALQGAMSSVFGSSNSISFFQWFILVAPLTLIHLFLLWFVLSCIFINNPFCVFLSNRNANTNNIINNINQKETSLDRMSIQNNNINPNSRDQHIFSPIIQNNNKNDYERVINENENELEMTNFETNINNNENYQINEKKIRNEMTISEWVVLLVFILTASLWMTRDPPGKWGWAHLFPKHIFITDGTVSVFSCLLLFIIPKINSSPSEFFFNNNERSNNDNNKNDNEIEFILSFKNCVKNIHWDIVFLLGGGFALSRAFQESGLTSLITSTILNNNNNNILIIIVVFSFLSMIITNFMSNVAVANILIPIIICVGPINKINSLYVLIPITLLISFAFLSPIGSPPNAIILINKNININLMFKVGLLFSIIFFFTTLCYCLFFLPLFYDIYFVSDDVKEACKIV